jgi:MoaA/NifB/PqqE/SkfB family radical SAM enzyme
MAGIGVREALQVVAASLLNRNRPVLSHLVVTRYCNLDCAYCNEFDKVSKPIPFAILAARVDRLAALGNLFLTFTGGEPLTNPDHERIIAYARSRGMSVTTITNGFLLTRARIEAMNAAGLQGLQISIDGVKPDAVTKKTLKSLKGKLELLAAHAAFPVNINSVLGITEERTHDALEVARFAKSLGFSHTVGVLHGDDGTLAPLSESQRRVYAELLSGGKIGHRFNHFVFQKNLIEGRPNDWRCRAGARYLYICEDGLVHYCSQQRGRPGIPLADYGIEDIRREFMTVKACAPLCTVSCVHQASFMDRWRGAASASPPLPGPLGASAA